MRYNTASDLCKALKISRGTLATYMRLAVPSEWEFKKEYSNRFPAGKYHFTTEDYKLFYSIRNLRRENIPYDRIKKEMTEEFIAKDSDDPLQPVLDFFSRPNEAKTDQGVLDGTKKNQKRTNLKLFEEKNKNYKSTNLTLDSREVAEMVDKNHSHLLRDIETYKEYLGESKIGFTNFFIESTYTTKQNKKLPNYQITKKGCEFIAHKLTGQKGALFTATYINRFHEMEEQLIQTKDSYMIQDPVERAKAWIQEQQEKEELKLTAARQEQIIGELKPKADYVDTILKSDSLFTVSQIAEDYGMTAQAMNKLLNKLGVQYKQNGQWLLYREHKGKGYTESETTEYIKANGSIGTNMFTKWKQKGRLFLYELLKEREIYPMIEID